MLYWRQTSIFLHVSITGSRCSRVNKVTKMSPHQRSPALPGWPPRRSPRYTPPPAWSGSTTRNPTSWINPEHLQWEAPERNQCPNHLSLLLWKINNARELNYCSTCENRWFPRKPAPRWGGRCSDCCAQPEMNNSFKSPLSIVFQTVCPCSSLSFVPQSLMYARVCAASTDDDWLMIIKYSSGSLFYWAKWKRHTVP